MVFVKIKTCKQNYVCYNYIFDRILLNALHVKKKKKPKQTDKQNTLFKNC